MNQDGLRLAATCLALLLSGCPSSRSAPAPAASASPPASSTRTLDEGKLDRLIDEALDAEQGK